MTLTWAAYARGYQRLNGNQFTIAYVTLEHPEWPPVPLDEIIEVETLWSGRRCRVPISFARAGRRR